MMLALFHRYPSCRWLCVLVFHQKSIIYVLTLLSSWYCKYFRTSSHNGVLCIFVIDNCVDRIENSSQLDLLYVEYSVHDGYLIGWSGIRTEQTEFRLVTMKFHRKINTIQNNFSLIKEV